jgi:hypothetical protein
MIHQHMKKSLNPEEVASIFYLSDHCKQRVVVCGSYGESTKVMT